MYGDRACEIGVTNSGSGTWAWFDINGGNILGWQVFIRIKAVADGRVNRDPIHGEVDQGLIHTPHVNVGSVDTVIARGNDIHVRKVCQTLGEISGGIHGRDGLASNRFFCLRRIQRR